MHGECRGSVAAALATTNATSNGGLYAGKLQRACGRENIALTQINEVD